jgi:hypothetical protein
MDGAMQRQVNDAFRLLRKRVHLFARRNAYNSEDAEDLAMDACERAIRHFRAITHDVELTAGNLGHYVDRAHRRAIVAVYGARIDAFRKSEVRRRALASVPPDLAAVSWIGGGRHAPAPDQRLIVRQTMAAVERASTTPGQRHLSAALRRHVEADELEVTPVELAEEAEESPDTRSAWARKLRAGRLD